MMAPITNYRSSSLRHNLRIENAGQYFAVGLELDPNAVIAGNRKFVWDRDAAAVGVRMMHRVAHGGVVHRRHGARRFARRLGFALGPGLKQLLGGHRIVARGMEGGEPGASARGPGAWLIIPMYG